MDTLSPEASSWHYQRSTTGVHPLLQSPGSHHTATTAVLKLHCSSTDSHITAAGSWMGKLKVVDRVINRVGGEHVLSRVIMEEKDIRGDGK